MNTIYDKSRQLDDVEGLEYVKKKMIDLGFEKAETYINPVVSTNRYYSYVKTLNSIEYEVKVRDKSSTEIIVKMHEKILENITKKQEKYFTYAKFLMKNEDKLSYKHIKVLIAETYFCDVEGSYLFYKK